MVSKQVQPPMTTSGQRRGALSANPADGPAGAPMNGPADSPAGDPRVRRTRAALQDALIALLREKDWSAIRTSEICRRAGVARSSLYEHCNGKGDILDEIFAAHLAEVCDLGGPGDPLCTLDWLVDHVGDAPTFFARAMAGRRGDTLLPRFRAALTLRLEAELGARAAPEPAATAAFVIGGALAYLSAAPSGDARETVQRMAAQVIG